MEKFRFVSKEKVSSIPLTTGIYALAGPREILYIGKANNLKERIKNHFQQPSWRDRLFMGKIRRIGYIETPSEIDALLSESALIKKVQPKYNVMWRDDKGYFYVAITRETLPRVSITHQIQNTKYQILNTTYVGPFVDGRALKQVLRLLRRAFPYYTQAKHFAKPCQWCHLKLCPGPNPNPKGYRKNIQKLAAILKGKRKSVATRIEKEMKRTAKTQDFERAAELRNQLFALQRVISHTLRKTPEHAGAATAQELQKIFETKKPILKIEAYDISNIQGQEATGSLVTFLNGKPAKQWYRKFKIRIAGKSNDFAMMQELISRRLCHLEWPYPDLMIIDGGKPQLTAALQALHQIQSSKHKIQNKSQILVGALAKQKNELFLPGKKESLLLKDMAPEAKNLLMHLRDEAHRFAISYHRKLRAIDLLRQK